MQVLQTIFYALFGETYGAVPSLAAPMFSSGWLLTEDLLSGHGLQFPAMILPVRDAILLLSPSAMLYGLTLLLGLYGELLHAFCLDVDLSVAFCLGAPFPFCIIFQAHTSFLMQTQMILC